MANTISNSDDVIDSRDVIERIDELETELTDAYEGEGNSPRLTFDEWVTNAADDDAHTLQDAAREFKALKAVADEAEGYASDWKHGEAMIRDSYFETYARELADDIGAVSKDQSWPNSFIDWEAAADALKQDYTSVDFDGVEYWVRS